MKTGKSATLEEYEDLMAKLKGCDNLTSTALYSYLSEEQGLPAIHAVLGGIVANDIIKVVSKKGDLSVDKLFMYSILDDGGWTGFWLISDIYIQKLDLVWETILVDSEAYITIRMHTYVLLACNMSI